MFEWLPFFACAETPNKFPRHGDFGTLDGVFFLSGVGLWGWCAGDLPHSLVCG